MATEKMPACAVKLSRTPIAGGTTWYTAANKKGPLAAIAARDVDQVYDLYDIFPFASVSAITIVEKKLIPIGTHPDAGDSSSVPGPLPDAPPARPQVARLMKLVHVK